MRGPAQEEQRHDEESNRSQNGMSIDPGNFADPERNLSSTKGVSLKRICNFESRISKAIDIG